MALISDAGSSAAQSLRKDSIRGGVTTAIGQGSQLLLRLASQILLARFLLPQDFGLLAIVAPVLSLVGVIATFGLSQTIVQRTDVTDRDVNDLFWLGLGLNALAAAVVMACSPLLAVLYKDPRLVHVCVVLALFIPLSGASGLQEALLTRRMRFRGLAALDVLRPTVALVSGSAAALAGAGYWALIVATGAESVLSLLFASVCSGWRPTRPTYNREIWRLIKVGGHLTASNLAGYVTVTFDNILLGLVHGQTQLGLYDRSYRIITNPLSQLMTPFNRVALPLLLRMTSDEDKYRATYLRMVQVALLLGAPGILTVMVFSRPLFLMLLGPYWVAIAPIATWMCVGALASTTYSSTMWLFATQGRTSEQVRYVTVVSLVSLVGFVAGLPWRAEGVAAGGALSFLLVSTPLVCWGATRTGAVNGAALGRALVPLVGAVVVTSAVLWPLSIVLATRNRLWLLVTPVVAYLCFLAALLAFPTGRLLLASIKNLGGSLFTRKAAAPAFGET